MFVFYVVGRGGGGKVVGSAQPVFIMSWGTHFRSSAAGASLDTDAVGARIIAGATRATKATGREAVAVTKADIAALLAAGARTAESFFGGRTLSRIDKCVAAPLTNCLKTQGRRLLRRSAKCDVLVAFQCDSE